MTAEDLHVDRARTWALPAAAESFLVARIGEDLRHAAQVSIDDADAGTRFAAEAQAKAGVLVMYRYGRAEICAESAEHALREVLDLFLDVYRGHPNFDAAWTSHGLRA
ncbi:hypothetical protein NBRGN_110_03170 [Nocardia brasiliensis NBRC 14402]|uniref:hypothetical protein n=1 Tax=Nocardia brasiliensis TaxID=37326 RepID=UPI0002EBF6DB|nr:hypothetical protein [Nocardia brasiliensis]ASF09420.1 hypothetical protein CEQ30_20930 [Nocardia brasiliensis]GAJ86651.1 hypothetical protein NBRGN_110_03170 [Nocardia brasiliensis NBRC 14402]SUB39880.1 Uncharacterised protein [Nocardia brasiliensis]